MGGWCVCVYGGGGGGLAVNFLMLSPEMLKSQIPISWVGGWWGGGLQSTFDTESRNAKIPNSHFWGGWVGGWVWGKWWSTFDAESRNAKIPNNHFWGRGKGWQPTFDAKSRNAKIPNSHFWGGGGWDVGSQLLMLSPEMLKSQIPISGVGGLAETNFQKSTSNFLSPVLS